MSLSNLLVLSVIALESAPGSPASVMGSAAHREPSSPPPFLSVQTGHSSQMEGVELSRDGRLALTWSLTQAILWETRSGRQLQAFPSLSGVIAGASLSSDGQSALIAQRDGLLRVFSTTSLWAVQRQEALQGQRIESAGLLGVGPRAYILTSKDVQIWDPSRQPALAPLAQTSGSWPTAAASRDGSLLALAGTDLKIIETATGKVRAQISPCPGRSPAVMAFSPDNRLLLIGGSQSEAGLFRTSDGSKAASFSWPIGRLEGAAFSPDGSEVHAMTGDGQVRTFRSSDGRAASAGGRFSNTPRLPRKMAYSLDGQSVAVAGPTEAQIWTLPNWRMGPRLTSNLSFVTSGDVSSLSQEAALGGAQGTVSVWDFAAGVRRHWLSGHTDWVGGVAFSRDGSELLTAANDGTAKVWRLAGGAAREARTLPISSAPDWAALLPQGAALRYQAGQAEWLGALNKKAEGVQAAAASADGRLLLIARGLTATVSTEFLGGRTLSSFALSSRAEAAALSPDGSRAVIALRDGSVRLWNTAAGREEGRLGGTDFRASSLAFSPDGTKILGGAGRELRGWDASSRARLFGFTLPAKIVRFVSNDRFMVVGYDGVAQIFALGTVFPRLVLRLMSFRDGSWVAVTPEGRFDGTGFQHLHWVRGLDVLPLEAFFEAAYTPGLVGKIMRGERLPPVNFNVIEAIEKRPTVRITSPSDGATVDGSTLVIQAEALDRGLGVAEIRAFLNGQRVDQSRDLQRVPTRSAFTRSFRVDLSPGRNVFRVVALSSNGIESDPAEITVTLAGNSAAPDLHLLAVGINQYATPSLNLRFARRDAEAVAALIQERAKGAFATVHSQVLVDGQATRAGILRALEQVKAKARPQDAFVFFFAGHGVCDPASLGTDEFFLVTSEVPGLAEVPEKALGLAALRPLLSVGTGIKANKKLLILDACQAGAAAEKDLFRSFNPEEAAFLRNSRSTGWLILASSLAEQVSREVVDLGHGLFTYSLLDGMRGPADGNKDGRISTKELDAWLGPKMEAITIQRGLQLQRPVSAARGEAFDLILTRR